MGGQELADCDVEMVQTPFTWRYGGRQVSLSGSFNGYSQFQSLLTFLERERERGGVDGYNDSVVHSIGGVRGYLWL